MGRAFVAVATRVKRCPLEVDEGCRMAAELPELVPAESDKVCALALVDLVPVMARLERRLDRGQLVQVEKGVACTGCRPRGAWVEFSIHYVPGGLRPEPFGDEPLQEADRKRLAVLRRFPMFERVGDVELLEVSRQIRAEKVDQATVLIRRGDRGRYLYLIERGAVRVLGSDDTEIARLGPGECFGEMSLLTGNRTSAAIEAAEPTILLTLDGTQLADLLDRAPRVHAYFNRVLVDRLQRTSSQALEEHGGGVTGTLSAIPPSELVQMLQVTERQGTLVVRADERQPVEVVFYRGRVYSIGGRDRPVLEPEDALEVFYDLLTWTEGRFRFEPCEDEPERTFYEDLNAMLLEGMRRVDEAARPDDGGPAPVRLNDDQVLESAWDLMD